MYPPDIARVTPDATAYIMAGTGENLSYAALDAYSNQFAHYLLARGIRPGDSILIAMENRIEWPIVVAAGMRSGLYVTPVNSHLRSAELSVLLDEARPAVVVTSPGLAAVVADALGDVTRVRICVGEGAEGYEHFFTELWSLPTTPIDRESMGARVLYSGGTTGRPKAFRQKLLGIHPSDAPKRHGELMAKLGVGSNTVMLSPAPNYHAAPFTFQLTVLGLGGTVVCMEKFDTLKAMQAMTTYGVTLSQWVPTMLVRLLELHRHSDIAPGPMHRAAVTSGAPCPAEVKQRIDEWWGPVLHEYYGASEGYGHTYISPLEARERVGSVGRPLGATAIHISDDAGVEVPAGTIGKVWFESLTANAFVNENDSTAADWKGMGDLGEVDQDGYLYLRGRAGYTIISGGVNIYPDEIEATLLTHPAVVDAAVFGEADADFGERVVAVVELSAEAGESSTGDALIAHCRTNLASFKSPRRIIVIDKMPRLPTGKLNKKLLHDTYADTVVTAREEAPDAQ